MNTNICTYTRCPVASYIAPTLADRRWSIPCPMKLSQAEMAKSTKVRSNAYRPASRRVIKTLEKCAYNRPTCETNLNEA
eukprot:1393559-Amorphochlora_amoeboformis.AAC.1